MTDYPAPEEVQTYTISYKVHKGSTVTYHRKQTRRAVDEFMRDALANPKFAWFYVEREGGAPFKGQDKPVD